jgi:hypothetical protein
MIRDSVMRVTRSWCAMAVAGFTQWGAESGIAHVAV